MFIRYNETLDFWEYDSSTEQTGAGPWIKLPVDAAKLNNLPPPYTLPANVALRDALNTFTLRQTFIASMSPEGGIVWYNASAPAENRYWHDINAITGHRQLYPVNDTQSVVQNNGYTFGRDGYFTVPAGIAFPGTQISHSGANVLDDYEEGSFTPSFFSSDGGSGTAYAIQVGRYTKIGNFCCCHYDIQITSANWTGGYLYLAGFPFSNEAVTDGIISTGVVISFNGLSGNFITITPHVYVGAPYGHLNYKATASANNDGALVATNLLGNSRITGTIYLRTPT